MLRGTAAALLVCVALAGCTEKRQSAASDDVFVSNEGTNSVFVVDGATGTIEGQLATGQRPRGMQISRDGKLLYVAASNANRIEAWDVKSRKLLRTYNSGADPERFDLSPDGKTMYVANENDSAVSFLDLASGKITREVRVGPEPEGITVSPDGGLAIATSEVANLAHFIDTNGGKVIDSKPVGTRPRFVLFTDGGRKAWVSSEQRGTITIFDTATRKPEHVIDLTQDFQIKEPVQAVEMRATRDGKRVFVAMGRSNRAAEIDPTTYKVVRSFPTGERTWGIALSPDEKRLYAVSGLSGSMTVIDLEQNRVAYTVLLGGKPWGAVAVAKK